MPSRIDPESQGLIAPDSLRGPNASPERIPTKAELLKDCASAVQQLTSAWDLEVEAVVFLVPKHSKQYAFASTIIGHERTRDLFKAAMAELATAADVKTRGL